MNKLPSLVLTGFLLLPRFCLSHTVNCCRLHRSVITWRKSFFQSPNTEGWWSSLESAAHCRMTGSVVDVIAHLWMEAGKKVWCPLGCFSSIHPMIWFGFYIFSSILWLISALIGWEGCSFSRCWSSWMPSLEWWGQPVNARSSVQVSWQHY